MRYLLTIALILLALPGWAVYTERYVTSAASGGGVGTEGDPWTLAESFANAVAGDRVNIQSDSAYSLGATTQTNPGSATDMILFRGYNASIGDLEGQGRNADGSLNTTNFPAITLTGILVPATITQYEALNITGALSSVLISSSSVDSVYITQCAITNSQNNSSARCVALDNTCTLINSDFKCSGAAHAILVQGDVDWVVSGCRFDVTADTTCLRTQSLVVTKSTFIGNSVGTGIYTEVSLAPLIVQECTFYLLDEAVQLPNTASLYPVVLIDNHATDNGKWIDSLYAGTAEITVIEVNNRTRDNTTPRTGVGDGVNVGEITTDTGGAATDYVNAAAGNLRLISGAAGETAGMIAYSDVGAYQREPSAGGGTTIIIVED